MKIVYLAVFGLASIASVEAASALGLGHQYPQSCASGYRPDAEGNCQPETAQINRFCEPGYVYEPDPLGFRCDPPPQQPY